MIKIIVACDKNNLIGANGTLPWKIKEEMTHFKTTTTGHVVVMGRKTYDSLGMAMLPKRDNVVISRFPQERLAEFQAKYPNAVNGPSFVESFDEAVRYANFVHPKKDIFVIGGSAIYGKAIDSGLVDELIITRVKGEYSGDAYFPAIPDTYIAYPAEGYMQSDKFDILLYKKSPIADKTACLWNTTS